MLLINTSNYYHFAIMPFSNQKTLEIESAIRAKLASGKLNNWEKSFLENMSKLFASSGPATKLSDKQYKALFKLIYVRREATLLRNVPLRNPYIRNIP